MPKITASELDIGLNLFLDIEILKSCPGCLTNAVSGIVVVNRFGPFLLLIKNEDGSYLTVPLYSQQEDEYGNPIESADRIELTGKKTGPGHGWHSRKSFFSTLQFWIIPEKCLVEASHREMNGSGARQWYALGQPEAIKAIVDHERDSSADFHPFSN